MLDLFGQKDESRMDKPVSNQVVIGYHRQPHPNKDQPKPETYLVWFPSGNAAAVRREALCEAINQVLARDAEFSAIHDPQHGMLRK